jgi:hypothetical protein
MDVKTMSGPNFIGPDLKRVEFIGFNRTGSAVALGDVLMCDHLAADGDSVKGAQPGATGFCMGQLIAPATTGIGVNTDDPGAWMVVVIDLLTGAGANDTKVKVCAFGYVTAALAGSTNHGADLYPANGALTLTATQADSVRCVAKALCPDSTTGTGLVLFNGMLSPGGQTGLFA